MINTNYNNKSTEEPSSTDSITSEDRVQDAKLKNDCWKVTKIFLELLAIGGTCVVIQVVGFHSWVLLPLIGLNLFFLCDGVPYFLEKLPIAVTHAEGKIDSKEKAKVGIRPSQLPQRKEPKTAEEIWGKREAPPKELPFNLKSSEEIDPPPGVDRADLKPFDQRWKQVCDELLNDSSDPQHSA
jgi:hypothetical protein